MDQEEKENFIETTNKILADYRYDLSRFIKHDKNVSSSSPIGDKNDLWWRIDYLKMHGHCTTKLEEEVARIDREFDIYKDKNKSEYISRAYCDFKLLTDNYDPDNILLDSYEFENLIYKRTNIENLAKELGSEMDIWTDMEKIYDLDDILRDRISVSITTNTYHPVDSPYAPKEYWWLHLEDVYGSPKPVVD